MRKVTPLDVKVAHVRRAATGPTKGHTCHWPGCEKQVPPALWGCRAHWYSLPSDLRNKIWLTYKVGQEETKTPSKEYIAVAVEVQEWVAANAK